MRIILDMQSLHTSSRFRGIGRVCVEHSKEFIRQNKGHDIFLLINDANSGSLEYVRKEFSDLIPYDNILVFPLPLSLFDNEKKWAECFKEGMGESIVLLREAFISQFKPDFVFIYSFFEFFSQILSIKKYCNIPSGAIIHDFIPINDREYFNNIPAFMKDMYMDKLEEVKKADILFPISDFVRLDAERLLGRREKIFTVHNACRNFWHHQEIDEIRKKEFFKRYSIGSHFILYCGGIRRRKNVRRLIEAYSLLDENFKKEYSLFIVCGKEPKIQEEIEEYASSLNIGGNVVCAGYVSDEDLRIAYSLCSLFVFPSLAEGFGLTPLEAMSCGAPVIASNTTSIPEVIGFERALFDPTSAESIKDKIEEALSDKELYRCLKENAFVRANEFSWKKSVEKTWHIIEEYVSSCNYGACTPIEQGECIEKMAGIIRPFRYKTSFIRELSKCICDIYSKSNDKKTIYLELSKLSEHDAGTGIQRVSRNIKDILPEIADDYEVIPVRKVEGKAGYEYVRKFSDSFIAENIVSPQKGDVFFFPELSIPQINGSINYLLNLKERGVKIISLLYDMIPLKYPETCGGDIHEVFPEFLVNISRFDAVICDSMAVAGEYEEWLKINMPERYGICMTDWFHLGSDFGKSEAIASLTEDDSKVLTALDGRMVFLMVSTIEPRKKYEQVLDAFESLWKEGLDASLVIVGRAGWKTEELQERLKNNDESGKRLFWLSGISDAFLNRLYEAAACVIMASIAEGFGLDVVEAAHRRKPLIVRNIPVFREIAGGNAFYFDGMDGKALADCIRKWLKLYDRGEHPKSDGIKSLTWHESIKMLFDRLKKYI